MPESEWIGLAKRLPDRGSGHGTLGGANLNRNVAHPELGGGNETARFHNTIGWFRGLMAAYVACPAGGDASDRISQRWIA
jgi:hypothetical protein